VRLPKRTRARCEPREYAQRLLCAAETSAVGNYSLEVTSLGFDRFVNSGIILRGGNQVTVNVGLRLGDTSQAVQFQRTPLCPDAGHGRVRSRTTSADIIDLPLNGGKLRT